MTTPDSWILRPLGQVLHRVEQKVDPQESRGLSYFYVGLEDIESHTGRLSEKRDRLTEDADILSIKTVFKAGDILYGKLRPNLNKVYVAQQDGICSTDIWALRASEVLVPEFAAYYLRSPFVLARTTQMAAGANLPRISSDSFDRIPIPLPTVPEQRRILNIFKQLEDLHALKRTVGDNSQQLALALFEHLFGVVGSTKSWIYEPFGKHVTYSKYGPRFPDRQYSNEGVHILRTTDMNRNGTIRWQESPQLDLTDAQLTEHGLRPGTLLISRSGTIGPVALYDGPERTSIAGAYLIEFGLAETLDVEFARTLFLTPYIQRMLHKAVRSVAQPNINAPAIKEILIPVPPLHVQREFAEKVTELRHWQQIEEQSAKQLHVAANAIRTEAFTGALTKPWREVHSEELALATATRDVILHEHDARVVRIEEHAPPEEAPLRDRTIRHWLLNQLSDFQGFVRTALQEYKGTLLPDDSLALDNFCRLWPIEHETRPHDRVRRVLDQLADLGLIAKITVENGLGDFVIGYRSLRPNEETRLQDADRLQMILRTESTKVQGGAIESNEAKNDGGESQS